MDTETNFDAEENPPAPEPPAPVENVLPDAEEPAEPPLESAAEAAAPDENAPDENGVEASSDQPDELSRLVDAATRARLSAPDEERLLTLLKEAILGGRAGVARAVEVLPQLPWIVGVRGVEQTWGELTAGFRTQLLSGLAKEDTDAARRIRLSLARALFKLEVPVALKIALSVLKDLRDKETGVLSQRNAQIISNVFIGRGKPWLSQLPLEELKPAEVDLLVHCAVLAAFCVPHPPMTQLGVIKWTQAAGRLDKLQDAALAAIVQGIARWSGRWQAALRKEVADLPEAIASTLKPAQNAPAARDEPSSSDRADEEDEDDEDREEGKDSDEEEAGEVSGEGEPAPRKERPVYEPRPQKSPAATESREAREPREPRDRDAQRERPVYTPRNGGPMTSGGARGFSLTETLKSIEAHVQSLRSELAAAQAKLRQREDDRRPRRSDKVGPIIDGEPTSEELARLNLQLEARNLELQARIEELTQHSEDVATSAGAMSDQPVTDVDVQLRTLLGLKLQEDYEDFCALERDAHDVVVQQHYRMMIRHIFEVLREAKVPLEEREGEPTA
ncbi:MAG TPA: hypothetical protein VF593_01105 [Chthoniobacteraceae bacterium]|jgi:hypothetical protein